MKIRLKNSFFSTKQHNLTIMEEIFKMDFTILTRARKVRRPREKPLAENPREALRVIWDIY
jgi:hypothetical protein